MNYLKMNMDPTFTHMLDYLLCQQRVDGRFGYYIEKSGAEKSVYNLITDLYLPLTISAIWTLSEVHSEHFSLLNSIT